MLRSERSKPCPYFLERYYYIATLSPQIQRARCSCWSFFCCVLSLHCCPGRLFAWCISTSFVSRRPFAATSPSPFPGAASPSSTAASSLFQPAQVSVQTRSTSLLAPQCTLDGCNSRPPLGWTSRRAPLCRSRQPRAHRRPGPVREQPTGNFVHFLANIFAIHTFCSSGLGLAISLPPPIN